MSSDPRVRRRRSFHSPTRRRAMVHVLLWISVLGLVCSGSLAGGAAAQPPSGPGARASDLPVRAAFYYPWFPETERWSTRYAPLLGLYDSGDPRVLDTHVSEAKYAGLDAFISSYWGRSSPTARRLPLLLDAAGRHGFSITAYYEPESNTVPPSDASLAQDFDALYRLTDRPAWLRAGGRPVLFVYNTQGEGSCAAVTRLLTANRGRFYLNLKVFDGYRGCASQPDSWHQYGPAVSYDQQGTDAATVSPGFYKFSEASARLPRNPGRFRADLARQVASGAGWQLVTSFNEWGEGTSVEPSIQWWSASGRGTYLDVMRSVYLGAGPRAWTQDEAPSPPPGPGRR